MFQYLIKTDFFGYSLKMRIQVLVISLLLPVLGFFAGRQLDIAFETKFWKILLLLTMFPLTQFIIIKFIVKK